MSKYIANRGLEWEDESGKAHRVEAGKPLPADFPAADIPEHLKSGIIEKVVVSDQPSAVSSRGARSRKRSK